MRDMPQKHAGYHPEAKKTGQLNQLCLMFNKAFPILAYLLLDSHGKPKNLNIIRGFWTESTIGGGLTPGYHMDIWSL